MTEDEKGSKLSKLKNLALLLGGAAVAFTFVLPLIGFYPIISLLEWFAVESARWLQMVEVVIFAVAVIGWVTVTVMISRNEDGNFRKAVVSSSAVMGVFVFGIAFFLCYPQIQAGYVVHLGWWAVWGLATAEAWRRSEDEDDARPVIAFVGIGLAWVAFTLLVYIDLHMGTYLLTWLQAW